MECGKEFFNCYSSSSYQSPQCPSRHLRMIGDGKSGDVSFLGEDDMTSLLAGDFPAKFLKSFNNLARL